jgi:hypothetical protein
VGYRVRDQLDVDVAPHATDAVQFLWAEATWQDTPPPPPLGDSARCAAAANPPAPSEARNGGSAKAEVAPLPAHFLDEFLMHVFEPTWAHQHRSSLAQPCAAYVAMRSLRRRYTALR